jgi:hypothetical protein
MIRFVDSGILRFSVSPGEACSERDTGTRIAFARTCDGGRSHSLASVPASNADESIIFSCFFSFLQNT